MKNCKKIIAIIIATILMVSAFVIPQTVFAADYKTMRDITAYDLVAEMKSGVNVGNSLDSALGNGSGETSWGNPKITKDLILAYKNAGFDTIRLPVTWQGNMESDGTPKTAWLNRVQEIVNWILEEDLYCILNTHHEQAWLNTNPVGMDTRKAKFQKLWTGIANRFKDYGDHLLFEGFNEILKADGDWSAATATDYQNANTLSQAFVDTVRSTGGKNSQRILISSTYGAIHKTEGFVLPTDTVENKLAVEFHCYYPQEFCFTWGSQKTWGSYSDNNTVDNYCETFYEAFSSKKIPVILGEFGAVCKDNDSDRAAYAEKVVSACKQYDILPIWWDNGNYSRTTADKFGLFDRYTYVNVYPEIVSALTNVETSSQPTTQPITTVSEDGKTILATANNWRGSIAWSKTEGWHTGNNNLSNFNSAISVDNAGFKVNTTGITFNSQQAQIQIELNKIKLAQAIKIAKENNAKIEFDIKVNSALAGSSPTHLTFTIAAGGKTIIKEEAVQNTKHVEIDPDFFDSANPPDSIVVKIHAGEWNKGFTFADVLLTPMVVYGASSITTATSSATQSTSAITTPTTQPTQPTQPSSVPSTQPSSQAAQGRTVIDWDVNQNYYTPGTPTKGDFGISFTGATGRFINSWNNDTTGLIGIEYTLTGSGSVRVEIDDKEYQFVKPTADGVKVTAMFADFNITPSKTTQINFTSLNTSDVTISDIKGLTASAPTTQPTSVPSTAYTVKIDGVAIENNGSEFTFPVSTKKGFIAYTDSANYYDVGDKISISKNLEFTTVAIGEVKMLSGASIRLAQRSGIRFETKVDTAKLGALPNTAKVEKGTLITLKELATSDLTLDSTYQTVNVKYTSNSYRENDTFAGSIVNIKEKNIAKEFLGRGYVTVTIGDITKTIYADYADGDIANNTRSVAFIANAYRTTYADAYEALTDEQKAIIDKWANAIL